MAGPRRVSRVPAVVWICRRPDERAAVAQIAGRRAQQRFGQLHVAGGAPSLDAPCAETVFLTGAARTRPIAAR